MPHAPNFDRILGILCSVLDAYSAVLFLPAKNDNGEEAFYMASSFSLGNSLEQTALISEGQGLVGWILRNREPLLVSNFDRRRNSLGYYTNNEEHTIKAFMGCALTGSFGALCVDSKRQYSFAEKDQKLLHLFAGLIGQMRQDMISAGDEQKKLQYYAALRTIYTLRREHSRWEDFLRHYLDLLAGMTGFSYCLFCSRDPDGEGYSVEGESSIVLQKNAQTPRSFPVKQGVVGWVFRNGRPIFSAEPAGSSETPLVGTGVDVPHFKAVIALPILIQRRTLGVLCLANDAPAEITEHTKDFVSMASEHLALFLENLYVKIRLRELHQAMQTPKPIQ